MLRFPGDKGMAGLSCNSAAMVLLTGSIICLPISEEVVFAAMKVSLREETSGESGWSESSSISTGDDLLDPGLLEVHNWLLVLWETGFIVPRAWCGESYPSRPDAETVVVEF